MDNYFEEFIHAIIRQQRLLKHVIICLILKKICSF